MSEARDEWMRAADALALVSEGREYSRDGIKAICRRACVGMLRAKAELLWRRDNGLISERTDCHIPKEFWWAEGEAALEQDWDRGDFETSIPAQKIELKAFGVSFDAAGISTMMSGKANATQEVIGRAPSVKRGKPPPDEKILEQADLMHGRGMRGRDIAKILRTVEGFENVSNTSVRNLIHGRYKSGRRKGA